MNENLHVESAVNALGESRKRWEARARTAEQKHWELEAKYDELAARERDLAALVQHVLGQFDRLDRGEPLHSDEDARKWQQQAKAVLAKRGEAN